MAFSNGGRPYEMEMRNLYVKYAAEFEKVKKMYIKAREEERDNVDVLHGRYMTLRALMIDLQKMMGNCGYLEEDELKPNKIRAEKLN